MTAKTRKCLTLTLEGTARRLSDAKVRLTAREVSELAISFETSQGRVREAIAGKRRAGAEPPRRAA